MEDSIDALTECFICEKLITDAGSLPCVHTFCKRCLRQRQVGDRLTCPICRKEFSGSEIHENDFVQELIDERLTARALDGIGKSLCDICAEEEAERKANLEPEFEGFVAEPGTLATMHCIDCRKNLCLDCSQGHRKHCKKHVIVNLEDLHLRRASGSSAKCRKHRGEDVKVYCLDCRASLCMLCYAESHHSHSCKDIGKAAADFLRELKDDEQRLDGCIDEWSKALADLEKEWQVFDQGILDAQTKILNKGEEIKRLVDGHVTKLNKQLDSVKKTKVGDFEVSKDALAKRLSTAAYWKTFGLVLAEKGSPWHVVDFFHHLDVEASELETTEKPLELSRTLMDHASVVFADPDAVELIGGETEKVLGRIVFSSSVNSSPNATGKQNGSQVTSSESHSSGKLLGTIETDERVVTGVTYLNEELYIVCAWTGTVFIHQALPPFIRTDIIPVKDLRCPNDIAACSETTCLYVVDSENGCVWRIFRSGQYDRWMGKAGHPWTISVNRGRVVLTSDAKPAQIGVYGPGAGLLHRLKLPSAITSVQHAVELKNGNFIISHGRDSGSASRICEISRTGSLVRSFDGVSGSRSSPRLASVKWPRHVAVDGNEETVFVAEFSNHYVLRLDLPSMKLETILLSWDEDRIDAPSRLCYVPSAGFLVLGEATVVKVFNAKVFQSKTPSGFLLNRP